MRTIRRNLGGLALAVIGLSLATEVFAQEPAMDDLVAIDATRGRDLDGTQTMRVRIRNDLAPMGSVVVSVFAPTRPELVLGAVRPNQVIEWVIDTRRYPLGFRLVATGSQAGTRVSRNISVMNQARAKWNLGINLVRIERIPVKKATQKGAETAGR